MAQHTPGPWHAEADIVFGDGCPLTVFSHNGLGEAVAGIAGHDYVDGPQHGAAEETWANARLIAAAPDMADDLRTLRDLAAMVLNRQHAGQPISDRIWSDLYAATNKASATLEKTTAT